MLHVLGRLQARHSRWFVVGWLVVAVVGFGLSTGAFGNDSLFDRLVPDDDPQVSGEARTGHDLLLAADPSGPAVQLVLDGVDPAAPQLRTAALDTADAVTKVPHVAAVATPYTDAAGRVVPAAALPRALGATPLVAADRRAVLLVATLDRDLPANQADAATDAVTARFGALAAAFPQARAHIGGVTALNDEILDHLQTDLQQGEAVALPLSLLVMVVVFSGLLAAGLPIVGAVVSIAGALLSLLGFSYVFDLSSTVPSVVSVLGLGLCIDYGLLLVSRYREELRSLAGSVPVPGPADLEQALERTLGTAGRTVAFSAVTVAISLSGLMFFEAAIFRAVGAAGVSVVLVALLVALTLVPSLMALAGHRLVRPGVTQRIPGVRRVARRFGDVPPEEGAFSRLARGVQRRPLLVAVAVLGVLVAAALPALDMRLVDSGVKMLPADSAQRTLFETVAARFPAAAPPPVQVVSRAPAATLDAWGRDVVRALPGVAGVDPAEVVGSGDARVTVLGIRVPAGASGEAVDDVVRQVHAHRPAAEVFVTGASALHLAFLEALRERAPVAVGIVVLATFVLLFLMTGSVLVPLKALVMNVVSLGASFGVLVWMFQDGHLSGPLHFSPAGGIDTTIPGLVLAFAFGLSMDYEVFLLSRIKEMRDGGAGNDGAVVAGLQRSGRIITSAALVVVIVFAGFASGVLLVIKQMGVALAVAVAVDATLVRVLLVPATMTLLGEWNWWAPGPLRRLHDRFGVRE